MRVNIDSIVEAVLHLEPPPCEEGCWNLPACSRFKLACEQYAVYAKAVKRNKREQHEISKEPTRAIFRCIFPPEGQEYPKSSAGMRKALREVRT